MLQCISRYAADVDANSAKLLVGGAWLMVMGGIIGYSINVASEVSSPLNNL